MSDSSWAHARLLCPWDSLGKNTGVGSQLFLQGIFPLSHPYMTTVKTIALPTQTLVGFSIGHV